MPAEEGVSEKMVVVVAGGEAPRPEAALAVPPDARAAVLQDLVRDGIDVGIRFGRGRYHGLEAERLTGESLYPVVSPRYRQGRLPAVPQDLAEADLLRSNDVWAPWFQAAGLKLPEPSGGVMFEDQSMLIRSAVDGDGVALVRHVVAMQEIASGQLVR